MLWVLSLWLLSLLGCSVLLSLLFIEAIKDNKKTTDSSAPHSTASNASSTDT